MLVRQVLGAVAEFEKTTLVANFRRHGGASVCTGEKVEGARAISRPPRRCGAGKAARPQETEWRSAEPAGDLGIAGRARPPQRARQAVQSKSVAVMLAARAQ